MKNEHDNFKDNYEWVAIKQFVPAYNAEYGTTYAMPDKRGDFPDFILLDNKTSASLKVEVTMLTEAPRRPIEWRQMLKGTFQRKPIPETYNPNVLTKYADTVRAKLDKKYGSDCSLLAFHWGPPVPWEFELPRLRKMIDFSTSPYDQGVFLVSWNDLNRLDKEKDNK